MNVLKEPQEPLVKWVATFIPNAWDRPWFYLSKHWIDKLVKVILCRCGSETSVKHYRCEDSPSRLLIGQCKKCGSIHFGYFTPKDIDNVNKNH